jgi:hypothetical protein
MCVYYHLPTYNTLLISLLYYWLPGDGYNTCLLHVFGWVSACYNVWISGQISCTSTYHKFVIFLLCHSIFYTTYHSNCGLRRGSSAARLLGSWVRISPGAWMSVSCECCVMSGRGLCDGLIPRPEESYRLWCVSNVCDHETSTKRGGPGPYRAVEPYKKNS